MPSKPMKLVQYLHPFYRFEKRCVKVKLFAGPQMKTGLTWESRKMSGLQAPSLLNTTMKIILIKTISNIQFNILVV